MKLYPYSHNLKNSLRSNMPEKRVCDIIDDILCTVNAPVVKTLLHVSLFFKRFISISQSLLLAFFHHCHGIYARGGWGHPLLDNNNLQYRHHSWHCAVRQRALHKHTRSHTRTHTNVDHERCATDLQHKHSTARAKSGRHHPKLSGKQDAR